MMPQWISDLITVWPALGAICVTIFVLSVAWKWLRPIFKKIDTTVDDLNGRPSRPGVPAQPGFMERFSNIETWMTKYGPVIDKMEHELHPNSGSSLADAVNRTEEKLNEHIAACPPPQQTTINVGTTS